VTPALVIRRPLLGLLLNSLLLLTFALLLFGLFAPLIRLERFYVFSNEVSLYSGLVDLHDQGEWFLFGLILVFSVLFPLLKLLLLGAALNLPGDRQHGPLHWLTLVGKWSMLDVFVVALLVVSVKLRGLAAVEVQPGAYAFAASVLLTLLLVPAVRRLGGR
jgi:paraquat-inducible protein A